MKVNNTSPSRPPSIRAPTQEELKTAYRSTVQQALQNKTAKVLKAAPKNAEKYSHFDITPKGLMGSRWEVYVIKGNLILKATPVVPNPKSTWSNCGKMPIF